MPRGQIVSPHQWGPQENVLLVRTPMIFSGGISADIHDLMGSQKTLYRKSCVDFLAPKSRSGIGCWLSVTQVRIRSKVGQNKGFSGFSPKKEVFLTDFCPILDLLSGVPESLCLTYFSPTLILSFGGEPYATMNFSENVHNWQSRLWPEFLGKISHSGNHILPTSFLGNLIYPCSSECGRFPAHLQVKAFRNYDLSFSRSKNVPILV